MTRECGPSPPMRNRMDALHSTVCSAIIRISRRNRLIANSQMSRAQTPYTWHMGTHHRWTDFSPLHGRSDAAPFPPPTRTYRQYAGE